VAYKKTGACDAAMCHHCMTYWQAKGYRKKPDDEADQNEPSTEEKQSKERQREAENVDAGKCGHHGRGAKRRHNRKADTTKGSSTSRNLKADTTKGSSTSRNLKNSMSQPAETSYIVDENGCSHDDMNKWEKEENYYYLNPELRRKHAEKDPSHKEVASTHCIDCKSLIQ